MLAETGTGGANSTGSTQYIYLPTANGPMPIAVVIDGEVFAVHSDHLNTPRRLTNGQGQAVWQWAYSAFGDEKPTIAKYRFANLEVNPNPRTTSIVANVYNVRGAGQYFDVESGLRYNYFRSLMDVGRYTQPDPIGLGGGLNCYGRRSRHRCGHWHPRLWAGQNVQQSVGGAACAWRGSSSRRPRHGSWNAAMAKARRRGGCEQGLRRLRSIQRAGQRQRGESRHDAEWRQNHRPTRQQFGAANDRDSAAGRKALSRQSEIWTLKVEGETVSAELYEPWIPPNVSGPMRLAFDAMRVGGCTLTIQLHEVGGSRRNVLLEFESLPLSINMVNESHRLNSLKRLPKTREGSLYLVRNSELLEAFHNEAAGIYRADPLLHFSVVTDEWIDLILAELPRVTA
ncbi:RHS repeat domain-containing protein [Variovorax sp. KK3]|uniref:RHS repeat domain-containing protein n=1 Tax=Variovorax sp. KK3 TaxID=1855728 RepID=UPI00117DCB87|nr:RHS repeat protein [Variovorax sp. KK3]